MRRPSRSSTAPPSCCIAARSAGRPTSGRAACSPSRPMTTTAWPSASAASPSSSGSKWKGAPRCSGPRCCGTPSIDRWRPMRRSTTARRPVEVGRDMTTTAPQPLDLASDLFAHPRLVIEASAGTGKTFTLAALVSRYVAELGTPIDEILVVDASPGRPRPSCASASAGGWSRPPVTSPRPDPAGHRRAADPPRRVRRRHPPRSTAARRAGGERLRHGHHHHDPRLLPAGARHDRDRGGAQPRCRARAGHQRARRRASPATCSSARRWLARSSSRRSTASPTSSAPCLNNPGIDVVAASGQPGDERLARLVRAGHRGDPSTTRRGGNTTYDSLLTSVRDAVVADPALRRRIAERYEVALIDEFQDTDPVQWQIFSSVFGDARPRRW